MYSDQDKTKLLREDVFKKKFKYYKSNKPKPSLKQVITVIDNFHEQVNSIPTRNANDPRAELLGLRKQSKWNAFTFAEHPGLLLIKNPFTPLGQRYWIRRCLETYPRKPNKANIDIEFDLQDWWRECFRTGECNRQLQRKLRWTTLGYHHNWDTKVYSDDNRVPFPEDLAELSDVVATYLGYTSFKAEAAIVNYYHMDSTLSAHTDHSEVNLDAPLFSFSFGQSAIFLIGGKDKYTEPNAILLNSGDIVVMAKEARLCYHAVPKILSASIAPWRDLDKTMSTGTDNIKLKYVANQSEIIKNMNKNLNPSEWEKFNTYIEESRINMNVRQVLNEKQTCLADDK